MFGNLMRLPDRALFADRRDIAGRKCPTGRFARAIGDYELRLYDQPKRARKSVAATASKRNR